MGTRTCHIHTCMKTIKKYVALLPSTWGIDWKMGIYNPHGSRGRQWLYLQDPKPKKIDRQINKKIENHLMIVLLSTTVSNSKGKGSIDTTTIHFGIPKILFQKIVKKILILFFLLFQLITENVYILYYI